MSTWLPPTAEEQPEVSLVDWGAFEVLVPELGAPSIHVAGVRAAGGEGRVSSPVARVNGAGRCVVTSTGRVYRLIGAPGLQGDAAYVWRRWVASWRASVLSDATPALLQAFEVGQTPGGDAPP
jgi:hypothetical protein